MCLLRGQTPVGASLTGLGDLPEHDTGLDLSDLGRIARRQRKTRQINKASDIFASSSHPTPHRRQDLMQGSSQCTLPGPKLQSLIRGIWDDLSNVFLKVPSWHSGAITTGIDPGGKTTASVAYHKVTWGPEGLPVLDCMRSIMRGECNFPRLELGLSKRK